MKNLFKYDVTTDRLKWTKLYKFDYKLDQMSNILIIHQHLQTIKFRKEKVISDNKQVLIIIFGSA